MYIYTVHQAYISIIDGYTQNAVLQNCLLLSGTAVQFGSCPPLCTSLHLSFQDLVLPGVNLWYYKILLPAISLVSFSFVPYANMLWFPSGNMW